MRKNLVTTVRSVRPLLLPALLAFLAGPAMAQESSLAPPAPGDLVPAALLGAESAASLQGTLATASRDTVGFSRPWSGALEESAPAAPRQTSRSYWMRIAGKDLAKGVPVWTEGAGALVRLNPAPGRAGTALPAPAELTVVAPDGRQLAGGAAMELLANAEDLAGSSAPFAEGTVAFRFAEGLGAGRFVLRAPGFQTAPGVEYTLHVLDRGSAVELAVETPRLEFLHGENLQVTARLAAAGKARRIRGVEAYVVSPAGRAWSLDFAPQADGTHRAELPLDALEAQVPGLWEVSLAVEGRSKGRKVFRNVRTAFHCAAPTARLAGPARFDGKGGDAAAPRVQLDVEAATAGRYEVRGVLFGTDSAGRLVPLSRAHGAAWLDAGRGTLELTFALDPELAGSVGAPFEVRNLELRDQGRLSLLQRQALGLRIER